MVLIIENTVLADSSNKFKTRPYYDVGFVNEEENKRNLELLMRIFSKKKKRCMFILLSIY